MGREAITVTGVGGRAEMAEGLDDASMLPAAGAPAKQRVGRRNVGGSGRFKFVDLRPRKEIPFIMWVLDFNGIKSHITKVDLQEIV